MLGSKTSAWSCGKLGRCPQRWPGLHRTCVLGVSCVLYVRIRDTLRTVRTVRAGEMLRLPPGVVAGPAPPYLPRPVWISHKLEGIGLGRLRTYGDVDQTVA
eukprot:365861-Chlamydomonas_euryale.AAC.18